MLKVKYRIASEKDQKEIRELDLISADKELINYSQGKEKLFEIKEYFSSGGCFWIAIDEDIVVGMVGVRFIGNMKAKVKALRVHPSYRGQGIAKKLMNLLESYCQEHQIKEIILGVNIYSLPAINLYESIGYSKTEEKEVEPGVFALYYSKRLFINS